MADITEQMKFAESTPKEAAQNIEGGDLFNLGADVFKQNRDYFQGDIDLLKQPTEVEPILQRYVAQSTEHAAVVKNDIDQLSYMERLAKYTVNQLTGVRDTNKEIIELANKKMFDKENFSEEDAMKLYSLNDEAKNLAQNNYGIDGFTEKLPALVGETVMDIGSSLEKHSKLITAATTIGAGIGAGSSLIAGPLAPIAVGPATIAGASTGFFNSFLTAQVYDQAKAQTGATYNELSNLTKDDGSPLNLDEDTKKYMSIAVGAVTGGATAVIGKTLAKSTPFLNKLMTPTLLKKLATDPASAALRATLVNIGKAAFVGGGANASIEATRIVTETLAKAKGEGELNEETISAAFQNISDNIAKGPKNTTLPDGSVRTEDSYLNRILTAGATGSVLAGGTAAVAGTLGFKTTKAGFQQAEEAAFKGSRDVTPQKPLQIGNNEGVRNVTDIVPENPISPTDRAVKALRFEQAVEQMQKVGKSTKMNEVARDQYNQVRGDMFAQNGMKQVWVDPDQLAEATKDQPEKAAAVRNMIDPSGATNNAKNTSVAVPIHKFLEAQDAYPELLTFARLFPEDPNALEAKKYLEDLVSADQQRKEVLKRLDVLKLTPEERLKSFNIDSNASDADMTNAIGTKETADLLLQKLQQSYLDSQTLAQKEPSNSKAISDAFAAEAMLARVRKVYDGLPTDDVAGKVLNKALETDQPSRLYPAAEDFGEDQYMKTPTFTEALVQKLPKGEVKRFNEAQQNARQSVADAINNAAEKEMDRIRDVVTETALEAEYDAQSDRAASNPNLAIVDRFTQGTELTPDQRFQTTKELTAPHHKEGYSPVAIDPRTLPENLKEMVKDPQLKKHKVFVKGGVDLEDAARLIGVKDGETLLKILATTPSRKDLIEARVKAREADIIKNSKDAVTIDWVKEPLIEAYSDNTKNHIAEMKFLLDNEWPTTKAGIKRIANPLPRLQELRSQAITAIDATPIGQLNVNQFKVGEKRSNKIAIDAILKNEVEKAFVNKEAAALNSELTRATHIAIGESNKVFRFARKFEKPDIKRALKDAGPIYEKAAAEILDIWNLNPKAKGTSEAGSFQKWAKKMYESGEGTFEVPERLSDLRQSANELTVEQVRVIGDRLKSILHQAKMKNRLYQKFEDQNTLATIGSIAQELNEVATKNSSYDPSRVGKAQRLSLGWFEEKSEQFLSLESKIDRAQHLIVKLDNESLTGKYMQYLHEPLKKADANKVNDMIAVKKEIQAHVEIYGKKDYEALDTVFLDIPEFRGIKALANGKITKGQLLSIQRYRGTQSNIDRVLNFGVSDEILQQVMDRELTEKDMVLLQNGVFNVIESYKQRIADLELRTKGTDVKFIEPKVIVHQGKVYPGGHFPAIYDDSDLAKMKSKQIKDKAESNRLDKLAQTDYARQIIDPDYLKERTGSSNYLSMNWNNLGNVLEETIHDLNYRETIRDTYKLLSDEKIRNDIVSVVGHEGYANIADHVIDSAESVQMQNFKAADVAISNIVSRLIKGKQITALSFNLTSSLVQFGSLPFAIEKMGIVSGSKNMLATLGQLMTNPDKWDEYAKFAAEIHPSLLQTRENIDMYAANAINRFGPKENFGKVLNPLNRLLEHTTEFAFETLLGTVDQFNKTFVALSAYRQAINGEVSGIKAGDVANAKRYASTLVDLTQTTSSMRNLSPVQKSKFYKPLLMFYSDANNNFNNISAALRRSKNNFKESVNEAKNDNYSGAAKFAAAGASGLASTILILSLAKYLESSLRGRSTPLDNISPVDNTKDFTDATVKYMLTAPFDQFFDSVPLMRDMNFATDQVWKKEKDRKVEIPIMQSVNDTIQTYYAINHLLKSEEVSPDQQRASMMTAGTVIPGLPSGAIYKYLIKPDYSEAPEKMKGLMQETSDNITNFLKSVGYLTQSAAKGGAPVVVESKDSFEGFSKEYLNQLNNIRIEAALPGTATPQIEVPINALETIKQIESEGNPYKQNKETGKVGLFQFTKEKWQEISDAHPELGLSPDGRFADDTTQQEMAFTAYAQDNAEILSKEGISPTIENIYAAHIFGAKVAAKVLTAEGDTKIKTLVGEKNLAEVGLKSGTKVKEFKLWLADKVKVVDKNK